MNLLKIILILVFSITLFSCENSLNGPPNSNLTYEPVKISVGQTVSFGTIDKDAIKVKVVKKTKKNYVLGYPIDVVEDYPLHASNIKLDFFMYNDKYKITFNYTTESNGIVLQLYNFQILQHNP